MGNFSTAIDSNLTATDVRDGLGRRIHVFQIHGEDYAAEEADGAKQSVRNWGEKLWAGKRQYVDKSKGRGHRLSSLSDGQMGDTRLLPQ